MSLSLSWLQIWLFIVTYRSFSQLVQSLNWWQVYILGCFNLLMSMKKKSSFFHFSLTKTEKNIHMINFGLFIFDKCFAVLCLSLEFIAYKSPKLYLIWQNKLTYFLKKQHSAFKRGQCNHTCRWHFYFFLSCRCHTNNGTVFIDHMYKYVFQLCNSNFSSILFFSSFFHFNNLLVRGKTVGKIWLISTDVSTVGKKKKASGQAVRKKKLHLVIAATPTDPCAMCISILLHNT